MQYLYPVKYTFEDDLHNNEDSIGRPWKSSVSVNPDTNQMYDFFSIIGF